jgi:transposase
MTRRRKCDYELWEENRRRARALFEAGNTIRQVVEALGVKYGTVAKWKLEDRMPTVKVPPAPKNVTPAPYRRGWPGLQWGAE